MQSASNTIIVTTILTAFTSCEWPPRAGPPAQHAKCNMGAAPAEVPVSFADGIAP